MDACENRFRIVSRLSVPSVQSLRAKMFASSWPSVYVPASPTSTPCCCCMSAEKSSMVSPVMRTSDSGSRSRL